MLFNRIHLSLLFWLFSDNAYIRPKLEEKRGFSYIQPKFEEKRGFSYIQPKFEEKQEKRGFSFIQPKLEEKRGFSFIQPKFDKNGGLSLEQAKSPRVKKGFSFVFPEKRIINNLPVRLHPTRDLYFVFTGTPNTDDAAHGRGKRSALINTIKVVVSTFKKNYKMKCFFLQTKFL